MALYYVFPFIGNGLYSDDIYTIYKVTSITGISVITFAGATLLFLIVGSLPRIKLKPIYWIEYLKIIIAIVGYWYNKIRFYFAVFFIALAFVFFTLGASSFRYSTAGISGAGSYLGIIIILNTLATFDLFYRMFIPALLNTRLYCDARQRLINLILSIALFLTASGTASLLLSLFFTMFSIKPLLFRGILFSSLRKTVLERFVRAILFGCLLCFLFAIAWIGGEIIKISAGNNSDGLLAAAIKLRSILDEKPEIISEYGYYLISAFSSHYYSFIYYAELNWVDRIDLAAAAINYPFESFLYRLNLLLNNFFDLSKPEYGSLSRFNYVILSNEDSISGIQGSSPGLLASFQIVFPPILDVIFCAIYTTWIATLVNKIMANHVDDTLSFFGLLVFTQFILFLFQSPIDFLIIIDNSFIGLTILISLAYISKTTSSIASKGNGNALHSKRV
jgi:hypothetical protein